MRYLRLESRTWVRIMRHWYWGSSIRSWGLKWKFVRDKDSQKRADVTLVLEEASATDVPYLWPSSTRVLSPDRSNSASKPSMITVLESPGSFVTLPMPDTHPQLFTYMILGPGIWNSTNSPLCGDSIAVLFQKWRLHLLEIQNEIFIDEMLLCLGFTSI